MEKAAFTVLTIVIVASAIFAFETLRPIRLEVIKRLLVFLAGVAALVMIAAWLVAAASGRDLGQWTTEDLQIRHWYQTLMQPDHPTMSCCGEADAYWCDDYYARDGHAYCRITDDRPDEPRGRPHRDIGSEFEIPTEKLKYDQSNPTGHGVIFLSREGYVYCFVAPGGV